MDVNAKIQIKIHITGGNKLRPALGFSVILSADTANWMRTFFFLFFKLLYFSLLESDMVCSWR